MGSISIVYNGIWYVFSSVGWELGWCLNISIRVQETICVFILITMCSYHQFCLALYLLYSDESVQLLYLQPFVQTIHRDDWRIVGRLACKFSESNCPGWSFLWFAMFQCIFLFSHNIHSKGHACLISNLHGNYVIMQFALSSSNSWFQTWRVAAYFHDLGCQEMEQTPISSSHLRRSTEDRD